MDFLVSSFAAALRLIGSISPDVVDAVRTFLSVSAGATVFAALFGVPVGLAVGLSDFRLKGFAVTALNTLMAVPTVVVGLLVYGFLSRQGPLGALGLLLGTLGIGAVLIRNAFEQRRELALLRAVGFRAADVRTLVLAETGLLLFLGLAIGTGAALVAILPALADRATLPALAPVVVLLAAVAAAGLLVARLAAGAVLRLPVLESLRSE